MITVAIVKIKALKSLANLADSNQITKVLLSIFMIYVAHNHVSCAIECAVHSNQKREHWDSSSRNLAYV